MYLIIVMHLSLNKNKIFFLSVVLFILTIFSCFRYFSGWLGLIILFLFFAVNTGYLFNFFQAKFLKSIDLVSTAIFLLSFYVIILSVIYYLFGLTSLSVAIFFVALSLFFVFLYKVFKIKIKTVNFSDKFLLDFLKNKNNWWLLFSLVCFSYFLFYFYQHQITDGKPSPWPSLWWPGFLVFALWSLMLVYFYFKKQSNWHNFLYLLLANIVVAISYVLAYGYDSLLHQASLDFIAQHGQITPLSPFYIGQYSLEVLIHFFTGFDFVLIERWFLPLFFVVTIFFVGKLILAKVFGEKNLLALVLSVVLLLPSVFFASSPFGFALLFSVLTLAFLYLFIKTEEKHFYFVTLATALAALFIHPFVGLNIILWILYWPYYQKIKNKLWQNLSLFLVFILSSVAVVFAFTFYNWLANKQLILYNPISYLLDFFNIFSDPVWYYRGESSVLEKIIYFYERIHFFLLLLFVWYFFPIKLFVKKKENAIGLIVLSALISSWLFIASFSITNYYYGDQANYAYRLVQVCQWLAWPLVLALCWRFLAWLKQQKIIWKFLVAIMLVFFLTMSWYLTYPRQDNVSRMSVNSARVIDGQAIEFIYQNEDGKDNYLVFANQLFGALAVKQYGFGPYYQDKNEEFLYYSLPWGGQLAQLYNQVMDSSDGKIDAILEQMKNVAQAVGLHKFYFIFSDVWAPRQATIDALENKASQDWQIENKVFIYQFEF